MPPEDVEEFAKWDQVAVSQPEVKRAKVSASPSLSSETSVVTSQGSDISWNSLDLAKAATLLGPNSEQVLFRDEDEMRRIFALLYDVFRYKGILNNALKETEFFNKHPKHKENASLIWLLFYDLHKRRFLPRVHAEAVLCADVFKEIGLAAIENDLWASRIKLAASLARSRIKNNALRLNQLLPPHLRDERFITIDETPVTGWINTFRKSKKDIIESVEKLGLKLQSKHETVLTKNDFRFDHLCPKLLLCHPVQRPELAQSPLIKNHTIVLQDRAFCIGPALMSKILTDIPLRGTVAQTHVNTPRTTAYLASVLVENDRIDKVVAFGAGDRLLEYQTYLYELGVTNCEIYAQKFSEIHPEAAVLENLVAVVATPPNSYTGVTDPVDLICSRGGDMKMLRTLTRQRMGEETLGYIEEQRETLKYCMSLPQVQIILYETHSVAPEENLEMVKSVIETINEKAKEKHEEEHRLMLEKEEAEEKANKALFIPGKSREQKEREKEEQEAKEAAAPKEVQIPPCDLFEMIPLPNLCSHGQECFAEEGCYLARIQRKEIISLDAKYMIKIAEARGLFGTDPSKKKVGPAVRVPKKQERRRTSSVKIKVKRVKGDADEISSRSTDTRRNSRSRKSQEESMRRLSRPIVRGSASPESFSSEIKPRFWRYATAKSVEDLIRALRRKRRGKRIIKVEDYFFFKDQGIFPPQTELSTSGQISDTGGTSEDISNEGKYINPNTFYERTIPEPYLQSQMTNTHSYYTDVEVIKPFTSKDVLRIMSYGAVSDRSSTRNSPATRSLMTLGEQDKCSLIQQCMDNASIIFKKIDEVIEENKKIAEKKIKNTQQKADPYSQRRKFKNKSFSPLEALSKIEEINNIIDFKKSHRTDIILPAKYLPGQQITTQQEEFIKTLQKKLERLQQSYQHWTKWKEPSTYRGSDLSRTRKKV